jgi:hypothetical protein
MHLGAALLQHPLPIGPLLSVTRLKDDLVLLSFGRRLAFFGNHTGRSWVKAGLFSLGSEMSKRAVSDEFDGLDAIEKAAVEAALNRCRVLAGQIESILRNERRHFVDEVPRLPPSRSLARPSWRWSLPSSNDWTL